VLDITAFFCGMLKCCWNLPGNGFSRKNCIQSHCPVCK